MRNLSIQVIKAAPGGAARPALARTPASGARADAGPARTPRLASFIEGRLPCGRDLPLRCRYLHSSSYITDCNTQSRTQSNNERGAHADTGRTESSSAASTPLHAVPVDAGRLLPCVSRRLIQKNAASNPGRFNAAMHGSQRYTWWLWRHRQYP